MPDGRLIFNVVMLVADTENYPCPHPFRLKVFIKAQITVFLM